VNHAISDQHAERALLSCLLNNLSTGAAVAREHGVTERTFANVAHGALYSQLVDAALNGRGAVATELAQGLKRHNWTFAQLTELWSESPILSGLPVWCESLLKFEKVRALISTISAIQPEAATIDATIEQLREDVDQLARAKRQSIRLQSVADLLNFRRDHDDSWLLGAGRWICRGGSMMLAGSTGAGKSSLNLQLAIAWALWGELPEGSRNSLAFNISARRSCRSLIIQAENDDGDMAETVQGVVSATIGDLTPDKVRLLDERLKIVRENETSGADFLAVVRSHVERFRPDICWIDPVMNYIGGDMSDQETVSAFCNGLNKISNATGVVFVLINHVPKPTKDQKGGAYTAYGSSAWANWSREVLTLERVDAPEGDAPTFKLTATKRRFRAGMLRFASAQSVSEIFIRHAMDISTGNLWVQCQEPNKDEFEEERPKRRKSA
jgi:hypothetical protein